MAMSNPEALDFGKDRVLFSAQLLVAHPQADAGRAKDYVELHDQVQTSVNLLDTLESFLSTFQKDLSAVSGQISELQDRSKDIENRLKSRRRIEKPLSNLVSDIIIPPPLATLILDTQPGEPWIPAIEDFERRLVTSRARTRVKAARDLGDVMEGLKIAAATKLRAFFLSMFHPIRSSVTTNMQVIQTSVLLKYKPLFGFLQRQVHDVANELQRAYVGAARVYYETGFRRYARSLGWVKARKVEKSELITSETNKEADLESKRLTYAKIDGPGVTLAYMADDKNFVEPLEALFRSLLLVFMDNATAEYTFISSFFINEPLQTVASPDSSSLFSPTLLSPTQEHASFGGSELGEKRRTASVSSFNMTTPSFATAMKEDQAAADSIWKQVMDPVLEYCQAFVKGALEPMPPVVPLLTMIRLTEDVVAEVQKRGCPPVESYIFTLRLQLWPAFQKAMSDHVDALKKLAEGASAGYFSRAATITEDTLTAISKRYVSLFTSFVTLTEQEEEAMIFSNLLRLRQELSKLILRYSSKISDPVAMNTALARVYDNLLRGLSGGTHATAHPKTQQEIAYWSNLEEDARRKIVSASQTRRPR
ncbi:Sac2 family-domain-containing protein [Schizophyllum commune]